MNLIKRLKPRFNVAAARRQVVPLDRDPPRPRRRRSASTAAPTRPGGDYFGPFASAGAVNRHAEHAAARAFLLRSCSDSVYRDPHPALHAAPDQALLGALRRPDHAGGLPARSTQARTSCPARAAAVQARARPSRCRRPPKPGVRARRAAARPHPGAGRHPGAQDINIETVDEADVFACHAEGGQACVQVFFFRAGQNWGNRAYFPAHDERRRAAEMLDAFIGQFYDDKPIPRADPGRARAGGAGAAGRGLRLRAGRKVEIVVPQRGEKRQLVEHALTNAREALGRRLAESAPRRSCWRGSPSASGWRHAASGSRSTTTATSRAPTRSAP